MNSKKAWIIGIVALIFDVCMVISSVDKSNSSVPTTTYHYHHSTQSRPSDTDSSGSYNYNSSSGASSGGTRNYTVDPDDYDNPDDFADDAYGSDFDDYDDAYDYWEDY